MTGVRVFIALAGFCVLAALGVSAAKAGPPYQTDDPEPTDFHHWEIYSFIAFDGHRSDLDGEAGLDLNYGAAKGLQLTATLPVAFSHDADVGWRGGRGDIELGAKYRVINDEKDGWQAAIFPRVILPTSARDLGGTKARLLLPVWVQKDDGRTSVFGGGGYELNPGIGNRDFWTAGIAVTRDVSANLQLGGEVSWQSADEAGGKSTTNVDIGLIRKLGGPFSLLIAAGPVFSGRQVRYHGYGALGLNF